MKRIAIDMDEVLADAVAEHLSRYNRHFNESLTKADLEGRWLWDIVQSDRHQALEDMLRTDDFFADLDVFPDAPRVLRRLADHYELFIASAAMEVPTSFTAKFRWIERHFPFIAPSHIVFCGDKGVLSTDFLIDDNPRQLRHFRGEGIIFSSPTNRHITGYRRVENWLHVEKLFLD